jgi:hypothetical protein
VENEDVRQIFFENAEPSTRLNAYVVSDSVAHLRLELPASDDPYNMVCCHWNTGDFHALPTLLNASGDRYVLDIPMPAAEDAFPFARVCLLAYDSPDCKDAIDVYLIPREAYLDELCDYLRPYGWERVEKGEEAPAVPAEPQAYVLHVVDQNGDPVPGAYVNFCTDTACSMTQSDESGTIVFDGAPDVYHLQLLKVPEGYSFDPDYEWYTGRTYGEWLLCIRKDG